MGSEKVQLSEAFNEIASLAAALKVPGIATLPGRVWTHRVDEHWTVSINANAEEANVSPEGTMGADVPAFHAAVWWNGWLAGLLSPYGGEFAAHPEGANEDRFIADLRAATEAAR